MLVVVSSPPGMRPLRTRGERLARAVYKAAVRPAQPVPIMTTFSIGAQGRFSARPWQVYRLKTAQNAAQIARVSGFVGGHFLEFDLQFGIAEFLGHLGVLGVIL